MENFEALKNCVLFKGISETETEELMKKSFLRKRVYRKGETVFSQGSVISETGIVAEGSVRIISDDVYGNRTIIAEAMQGEIFGEVYAFTGKETAVCAEANENLTALFFSAGEIINSGEPAVGNLVLNLLAVFAEKNLILSSKISCISKRTTREKLLTYLSAQAKKRKCASFSIPFNQRELAEYLCVDRSAMASELSKMKKEGIIFYERNMFSFPEQTDD